MRIRSVRVARVSSHVDAAATKVRLTPFTAGTPRRRNAPSRRPYRSEPYAIGDLADACLLPGEDLAEFAFTERQHARIGPVRQDAAGVRARARPVYRAWPESSLPDRPPRHGRWCLPRTRTYKE